MKTIKLTVKTNTQRYLIYIGSGLISNLGIQIKKNSIHFNKCLLVIDNKIQKKFISKIKASLKNKKIFTYLIEAKEKNKSQRMTNNILEFMLNKNFTRKDCLIAVGGGITGDISGFAASLYKRGLQFINIPTTLLAQVDSSIGGKTGVNTKYGKNLIGSFYQPKLVISDVSFLKTLPKREIVCGYGEILKHSLIADNNFFKFLDKNIANIIKLKSPFIEKTIYKSCKIKKEIVEKDEKEKNLRKILNFGHTFAHAYEATLGYTKKLNHGEAVLIGMCTALKFSYKKRLLRIREFETIINHMYNSNLPNDIKNYFSLKHLSKIISFMVKDKKNYSDKINLILLKKIGYPILDKVFKERDLRVFFKEELRN